MGWRTHGKARRRHAVIDCESSEAAAPDNSPRALRGCVGWVLPRGDDDTVGRCEETRDVRRRCRCGATLLPGPATRSRVKFAFTSTTSGPADPLLQRHSALSSVSYAAHDNRWEVESWTGLTPERREEVFRERRRAARAARCVLRRRPARFESEGVEERRSRATHERTARGVLRRRYGRVARGVAGQGALAEAPKPCGRRWVSAVNFCARVACTPPSARASSAHAPMWASITRSSLPRLAPASGAPSGSADRLRAGVAGLVDLKPPTAWTLGYPALPDAEL